MTPLSQWFRERKSRMPKFYKQLRHDLGKIGAPSLRIVQMVIYHNATDNYNIRERALDFLKEEIRREKEFEQKVKDELKKQNP